MDLKEFENKSISYKKEEPLTAVVDPTKIKVKQPSEFQKMRRNFFVEDGKGVISTLFNSVIIPGLKKLFLDGVTSATSTALYGKNNKQNQNKYGALPNIGGYTPYGAVSNNKVLTAATNTVYMVDDIEYADAVQATMVKDACRERLIYNRQRGVAYLSVNEYYDIIGIKGNNPNDVKFGWDNLDDVRMIPSNGGYKLVFPKVKAFN